MSFQYEIPSYDFSENPSIRGPEDLTFRWVEPAIPPDIILDYPNVSTDFEGGLDVDWQVRGTGAFFATGSGTPVPYGNKSYSSLLPLYDSSSLVLAPYVSGTRITADTTILTGDWSGYTLPHTSDVALTTASFTAASGSDIAIRFDAKVFGTGEFYILPVDSAGQYYDYVSETWGAYSDAVSGSRVTLVENDVRQYQLVYKASPNNPQRVMFRAVAPSGDYYVELDEIDIGVVEIDSFLGYAMPSDYYLQITKDLGWGDTLAMFNERTDEGIVNNFLFDHHLSSYTQHEDGSASTTISQQDLLEACPGDGQYLWRIVPLSSGGTKGRGGLPERFTFVGTISQTGFAVDKFTYSTTAVQEITGTRPEDSTISITGIPSAEVVYPDATSFRILFRFEAARYDAKITCTTSGGVSAVYELTVELPEVSWRQKEVASPQEGIGGLVQRPRLFGESRPAYQRRLRDAMAWRTNVDKKGLAAGIATELGLPAPLRAITFEGPSNIEIAVNDVGIRLYGYKYSERVYLEPELEYAELTYTPEKLISVTYKGKSIDATIDGSKLYFSDVPYVDVSYLYVQLLKFSDHQRLADLSFDPNITVRFDEVSGGEASAGLLPLTRQAIDGAVLYWSPVIVQNFLVEDFRDAYLNEHLDYFNTPYEAWVRKSIVAAFPTYSTVRCGIDYWDPPIQTTKGFEALPTLADSKLIRYSDGVQEYDEWAAWFFSYRGYYGSIGIVSPFGLSAIISGVGGRNDLKPSITEVTYKATSSFRRPLSHVSTTK